MAQLTIDDKLGIVCPTTAEIREDLGDKFQSILKSKDGEPVDIEPATPAGQLLDLIVAEIEAKNAEIAFLANQLSAKTATGVFLDAINSLYFIDRKVSQATLVDCVCTGLKGTVIPFGAIAQDESGNQFRCMENGGATIDGTGQVTAQFASVEHGALDVKANTVTQIVTVIAGWDSVTNPAAGITGNDRESDAEFRERAAESVAINAHGTVSALESSLANIDDVIDVKVLENYSNVEKTQYGIAIEPHSIAVCISGGEDSAIAEAIYRKKDAGCGTTGETTVSYYDSEFSANYAYSVVRPASTPFNIKIVFYASSMDSDVMDEIKAALVSDVIGEGDNSRIGLGETVYSDRFRSVIRTVTTQAIKSVSLGLGESPTYDDYVTINANQEPVIEDGYISIEFAGEA